MPCEAGSGSTPSDLPPSRKADRSTSTLGQWGGGGGIAGQIHYELTSHGHFFHLVQEDDIRDFQLLRWNKDTQRLPRFSGPLVYK